MSSGTEDAVLHAHASIRECLEGMPGADAEGLRAAVDRLADILPAHFAYEEREHGFVARIARQSGAAHAAGLRADHRSLLAALEGLRGLHQRAFENPGERQRALAFAQALADHEQRENQLALSWVDGGDV